jgi:hypothetical protein
MTERITDGVVWEYFAQSWHNVRHEGFLDIGPVRIAALSFVRQQEKNAFDLGRDYGRMEGGGSPVPPPPRPRHLKAV